MQLNAQLKVTAQRLSMLRSAPSYRARDIHQTGHQEACSRAQQIQASPRSTAAHRRRLSRILLVLDSTASVSQRCPSFTVVLRCAAPTLQCAPACFCTTSVLRSAHRPLLHFCFQGLHSCKQRPSASPEHRRQTCVVQCGYLAALAVPAPLIVCPST